MLDLKSMADAVRITMLLVRATKAKSVEDRLRVVTSAKKLHASVTGRAARATLNLVQGLAAQNGKDFQETLVQMYLAAGEFHGEPAAEPANVRYSRLALDAFASAALQDKQRLNRLENEGVGMPPKVLGAFLGSLAMGFCLTGQSARAAKTMDQAEAAYPGQAAKEMAESIPLLSEAQAITWSKFLDDRAQEPLLGITG